MKIRKLKRSAKKKEAHNPRLKKIILDVVEEQISSNEPPETSQTYQRLLNEGLAATEAKQLIGVVIAREIFYVAKEKREYDHEQFVAALNKLPNLPE
jgi:transcriptional regulator CtsR